MKDRLQIELDYAVQGTATEQLNKDIKDSVKSTEQLEKGAVKAKKGFSSLGDTISGNEVAFGSLGVAGGIALATLTNGVKESMSQFADFQDIMLQVESGSGSTKEEMQQLSDKARELGASTRFSATQMAEAQKFYAMAGYSASQINEALAPTANLASASGEEMALVADIVSNTMTSFKLAANETGRFTDVLAATSNASNSSVADMGETFKYVAPVAGAMGVSIEETARMIGILANSGIKGGQAGTTLRTALTKLNEVSPDMLKELGLNAENFNKLPIADKVAELSEKFKDMSGQQQTATAQTLFGQEAFSGMLTILTATKDQTAGLDKALSDYSGAAQKAADINNSGLSGSLDGMSGAMEELKITIGTQLTPVFQPLIDIVTTLTAGFASFLTKTDMAIPILTTLAGLFIGLMIPAIYMAATATWALIAPILAVAAPFIAVGAAIGLVIGLIVKLMDKFGLFKKVSEGIKGFFGKETTVNSNSTNTTKTTGMPTHRTGESFVPNDTVAQLHYGERVLTKSENESYTKGSMGSGGAINFTINATADLANEIRVAIEPVVNKIIKSNQQKTLMKMGIGGV